MQYTPNRTVYTLEYTLHTHTDTKIRSTQILQEKKLNLKKEEDALNEQLLTVISKIAEQRECESLDHIPELSAPKPPGISQASIMEF